jgi:UPF0755 protein
MTKRPLIIAAVLLLTLAAALALPFVSFLLRPVGPTKVVVVAVPAGVSFAETARRLEEGGVIGDARMFRLLARLRGDARRTQAGEYEFARPVRPGAVLDRLVSGDVRRRLFTIPEGLAMKEIAQRLEAEGFGPADAFLRVARDPAFIASLDLQAPSSLEGYLFPETYSLVFGLPPERILAAMVEQFRARLTPDLRAAAAARGLTLHQLVTLASIIQKEAGNNAEMPLISAVFHNRLKQRMPLQADPTVIYGIEAFDGNLTRDHLLQPTAYNTYRIRGLPPGPIASPGLDALKAAIFPADADYLYFVSRGNGTHVFSRTLAEHNQAVRQFQLSRGR